MRKLPESSAKAVPHSDHTFKALLHYITRAHLLKPIVTLILRGSQRGLELNIRELRMQICQDFANTFLEMSKVYNAMGKFELATLAQRFATIQLKRYAVYAQQVRAEMAS